MFLRSWKQKSSKVLTQDLKDSSDPAFDPLKPQGCSQRNGGCREAILTEGKQGERLRHVELHKDYNENQWQKILWSETKFDMRFMCVGRGA